MLREESRWGWAEICRMNGSQAAKWPWEELPTRKGWLMDTAELDWASLTRETELEAPRDVATQISIGTRKNSAAEKHGLHQRTWGWVEEAVQALACTHAQMHIPQNLHKTGGRWKWSLWVSPDQRWSFYFPPKKLILIWCPSNLSRSIEWKGKNATNK